jgi:hypothetical protein
MSEQSKPETKPAPEPSVRQQRYAAGVLAGKSGRQSAIDAGYSLSTANKARQLLDRTPAVRQLFLEALAAEGITPTYLATKIHEALEAVVVGRETAFAPREVFVDFKNRLEAIQLALRLMGALVEKHEVEVSHLSILDELQRRSEEFQARQAGAIPAEPTAIDVEAQPVAAAAIEVEAAAVENRPIEGEKLAEKEVEL